jgi:hypothetical protein
VRTDVREPEAEVAYEPPPRIPCDRCGEDYAEIEGECVRVAAMVTDLVPYVEPGRTICAICIADLDIKITGCTYYVRGYGGWFERDLIGTSVPPPDWDFPVPPHWRDVLAALAGLIPRDDRGGWMTRLDFVDALRARTSIAGPETSAS